MSLLVVFYSKVTDIAVKHAEDDIKRYVREVNMANFFFNMIILLFAIKILIALFHI